jgi:hypothetical protein
MIQPVEQKSNKPDPKQIPRNIRAASLTSFFMDISSEMVIRRPGNQQPPRGFQNLN